MTDIIELAVNGTLMRGLELNPKLINVGAQFIREDETDDHYRLWSINDNHPAMIRTLEANHSVALEVWAVPTNSVAQVIQNEPAGLSIGKVHLKNGTTVLGVIGEPWLVEGQTDISASGGWRSYINSKE